MLKNHKKNFHFTLELKSTLTEKPIIPSSSKHPIKPVIRYRRQRLWLYNFILRTQGLPSYAYHGTVIIIVALALFFFALSTVPKFKGRATLAQQILEIAILVILTAEYLLLIWCSFGLPKYCGGWKGTLWFIFSPSRIVFLLLIGVTAVVVWTFWAQENLTWVRCLMIFHILRLENRFKPWRFFRFAVRVQRHLLFPAVLVLFSMIVILAYVCYFLERSAEGGKTEFTNLPMSLYWAAITVATIGYGDVTPTTTATKIVGSLLTMVGVIAYALPPGILSTGLALRTYEQRRLKGKSHQATAAAGLIQATWRLAKSVENNNFKVKFALGKKFSKLKSAQIFIAKLKWAVARRAFAAAQKPYDVNDILERYSRGHVEVVERVKDVDQRLENMKCQLENQLKKMMVIQRANDDRVARLADQLIQLDCLTERIVVKLKKDEVIVKAKLQSLDKFLAHQKTIS